MLTDPAPAASDPGARNETTPADARVSEGPPPGPAAFTAPARPQLTWRRSEQLDATPADIGALAAARGMAAPAGPLQLAIAAPAWEAMAAHVESSPVEVGGILVGVPYQDTTTGRLFVDVIAALPARGAVEAPTYFQFTAAAWDSISQHRAQLPANAFNVGWYHSHPGLGVFYSTTDRASQAAFFNRPWNVGLVIDPVRDQLAGFVGGDCAPLDDAALHVYDLPVSGVENTAPNTAGPAVDPEPVAPPATTIPDPTPADSIGRAPEPATPRPELPGQRPLAPVDLVTWLGSGHPLRPVIVVAVLVAVPLVWRARRKANSTPTVHLQWRSGVRDA